MSDLARTLLAQNPDQPLRLRYGIVNSLAPLMVTVGGSTVSAQVSTLATMLSVGSYVAVIEQGADRLVLGEIGAPAGISNLSITGLHANVPSVTLVRGTRLGPFAMVQVMFQMGAATAGPVSLFTIPSDWWPTTNVSARGVNINAAGAGIDLMLNNAGIVTLSAGSTAAASQPYSATFMLT